MGMFDIEENVFSDAVYHFWDTRIRQGKEQEERGTQDQGDRSKVTGGKQMDGFVETIAEKMEEAGVNEDEIYVKRSQLYVPGYFRAEKKWDMLVVRDSKLLASIELKSQMGSYGNNFNNRSEEAIGNAEDLWQAYEKGVIDTTPQPWLGYMMLLNDEEKVHSPVRVKEPHFPVDDEFKEASYAERYEHLMRRLVRERKYNSACLLLTGKENMDNEENYYAPSEDLDDSQFLEQLLRHVGDF